jgi:hypothetical protein
MDLADVTQSLFPTLGGAEVTEVEALAWKDRRIGVKLSISGEEPFYFWVAGDDLFWGNEAALDRSEWPDGLTPTAAESIQV